jgi:pantoate--beta-alanine ligase
VTDVVRDPAALSAWTGALRASGRRVGFVPTMGALHEGHRALVREAARRADAVVVSIFVNPLQFGPDEDLARYPRDLEADVRSLGPLGVGAVFAPSVEDMYPAGASTRVRVEGLTTTLCGPHRPGHFEGVTTVCARLFGIVGGCVAVFGRKDYQQWRVVDRMVRDLAMPVDVVGHPIVRDPDGLAMSSRNAYLTPPDRERALAIPRALCAAWDAHAAGERRPQRLQDVAREVALRSVDSVDYVAAADPSNLGPPGVDGPVLLAIAAHVGRTRLIDNAVLGQDPRPMP